MKNWNWLLIAWYLIPILGWSSLTCYLYGEDTWGWRLLIATCIWIFIVIVRSLWVTRESDIKVMEDELIRRELKDGTK